jgi:hypothetical protein
MMSTSTQALDFTEKQLKETTEDQQIDPSDDGFESPSLKTIQAILNYSKNLEVKKSKFVPEIEFIRS